MKIKAKDGYGYCRYNSRKKHIVDGKQTLCGLLTTGAYVWTRGGQDIVDGSDMCQHCLRIARKRGLIEEVPEHIAAMPEGYRIMEVREEVTEKCLAWKGGVGPWKKNGGCYIGKLLDEYHYPFCCPIEQPSDKPAPPHEGWQVVGPFTLAECEGKIVPNGAYSKAPHEEEFTPSHCIGDEPAIGYAYALPPGTSMEPEKKQEAPCESCEGTGFYGDNGPGIIGNQEYQACECGAEDATMLALAKETNKANRGWGHLERIWKALGFNYDWEYGGFLERHVIAKWQESQDRIKELESSVVTDNTETLKNALAKIEKLEEENKRLKNTDKALTNTINEIDKKHAAKVEAMQETLSVYKDALEKTQSKLKQYREATNNHILENIEAIMQAAPKPEELEGYKLEFRPPNEGEERFSAGHCSWYRSVSVEEPRLIRTPIVQYLPTSEITDELCQEHGRIPCEVSHGDLWKTPMETELLCVGPDGMYITKPVDNGCKFPHCRIKQSTIDALKGGK